MRREVEFALPVERTALVLVDLWNVHHIEGWLKRASKITEEVVGPVVAKAREAGVMVVHAPSPEVAARQQQAVYREDLGVRKEVEEGWPPRDFRLRRGEYGAFAGPREQPPGLDFRWRELEPRLDMAPLIEIYEDEFLVANAEQLRALGGERGVLHLVYAGFAANWCVLYRDYGIMGMSGRGYNCLLIRDATEGIEYPDTLEQGWATELAIREVEQKYGFTLSSGEFMQACDAAEVS